MTVTGKAKEYLDQGIASLQQGDVQSALKYLNMSLSFQGSAEGYFYRVQAQKQQHVSESLLEDVDKALKLCEDDFELRNKLFALQVELIDATTDERERRERMQLAARRQVLEEIDDTQIRELSERFKKPSVRIHGNDGECVSTECKHSRFGGKPLAPPAFEWPRTTNGKPLQFLCQINLKEVSKLAPSKELPKEGLLCFFYESEDQPWGYDPKDRTGHKVAYFESADTVSPTDLPDDLDEEFALRPQHMRFSEEVTFPCEGSDELQDYDFSDEGGEQYAEFLENTYGDGTIHRLFGHPQLVQADWRLECQLVSHGIYCGGPEGYESAEASRLSAGSSDWILLLQIDSDNDGVMWGDSGRLYFCITKQALSARDWDSVWVVLQCY